MWDRDTWLEIFHTVLSNPLRTGLTGLSIALGIFILVVKSLLDQTCDGHESVNSWTGVSPAHSRSFTP